MKITTKKDRILLQSETPAESQAISDLLDKLWKGDYAMSDEIANAHGHIKQGDQYLNYVTLPLPVLAQAAKAMGSRKSAKKAAAVRKNGAKGGRPKKETSK